MLFHNIINEKERDCKLKIIDLTHTIEENMPVYPGTDSPILKSATTHEKNGFKETLLSLVSHTGTHIDPPFHILKNGATLDSFDISTFVGKGLVIDCRLLSSDDEITMAQLEPYKDSLCQADFLLFNLGWDKKWGTPDYFSKFPCMSDQVIDFIIEGNYKGIGFDVISIDQIGDSTLNRHKRLFNGTNIINIENLCNLSECGNEIFTFVCLPLKIKNCDGSPTRAIAIID
jgi:kynurenine formamidase